jgi:putative redox protein
MAMNWKATATLRDGVTFEATAGSGHSVLLDSPEVTGGGNSGFRPLEMLLIGEAGCSGQVVISILRRARQEVTDYRVSVEAVRAETHPKVFTELTIEHKIRGKALAVEQVRRAIATASGKYCPVVIMLGKAVPTVHRYRIVDAETGAEEAGVVEPTG